MRPPQRSISFENAGKRSREPSHFGWPIRDIAQAHEPAAVDVNGSGLVWRVAPEVFRPQNCARDLFGRMPPGPANRCE
jgi:hypothetical protein